MIASASIRRFCSNSVTDVNKPVNNAEIKEIYEVSDILIHVEPINGKHFDYIKYSMTTKIPEYLMSGKPILCVAPENAAITQFIYENDVGYTASDLNSATEALESIITDEQKRIEKCSYARQLAIENFTDEIAQKKLEDVFNRNIIWFKNKYDKLPQSTQ